MQVRVPILKSAYRYFKRNLRAKLFLFFFIASAVPLMILGYLSYSKSTEEMQSQTVQYGQSNITQLQSQLDSYSRQMKSTTRYIYSYLLDPLNGTLHPEEPQDYAGYVSQKNFNRFLAAHKTEETSGIYLITPSNIYFGSPQIDVNRLKQQPWWQAIPGNYRGEYWTGLHDSSYYVSRNMNIPKQIIGLVFPVQSQYGYLQNSRIVVEMDATKLLESFRTLENNLHSFITIRDKDGRLIYQSPNMVEARDDDLVWNRSIESSGWSIEVRTLYEPVYRSTIMIRYFTIALIGFAFVLVLLISYLFSARLTRRIISLKNKMQLVGIGQLQSRIEPNTEDELGRLGASFNKMVEQIRFLIEEVQHKEQLKKEAQLQAFHYQINPHLLLNTLNMIQWQAKLKSDPEIQNMIHYLIKVLEGNLVITEELIPLQKELQTVEYYLKIQEVRYSGAFEYSIDVNAALASCLIPRMTLQPLLENTFFHGFEDGEGTIRIEVREEGTDLVLTLEDDGEGIEPDKLATLLHAKQSPARLGKGGLGCYNVDQKFKLHFGEMYGMQIRSKLGEGTAITIRWPKTEGANNRILSADKEENRTN
ncbi:cache domain-containing sensor histidine kinase [Paenibacillus azoreducens]|uniref:Two-component sensor kinase n=1 Tax=Paenibacillus azoreducens TaxID=116718 RepID=A0A919YBK2_9BACL|nr:sensor histidine kinase [Paenibacillus azoreducens]GIO47414.1 putative two-component sensor kinase [Paenibacillus azoreducens]